MHHILSQENNPHIYNRNRHFSKKKVKHQLQDTISHLHSKQETPRKEHKEILKSDAECTLIKLGLHDNMKQEQEWTSSLQHSNPSNINFLSQLGYSMDVSRINSQNHDIFPCSLNVFEAFNDKESEKILQEVVKNEQTTAGFENTPQKLVVPFNSHEKSYSIFKPRAHKSFSDQIFIDSITKGISKNGFSEKKGERTSSSSSKIGNQSISRISRTISCSQQKLQEQHLTSEVKNNECANIKKGGWVYTSSGSVLVVDFKANVSPFSIGVKQQPQMSNQRYDEEYLQTKPANTSSSNHKQEDLIKGRKKYETVNVQKVLQSRENNLDSSMQNNSMASNNVFNNIDLNIFMPNHNKSKSEAQVDDSLIFQRRSSQGIYSKRNTTFNADRRRPSSQSKDFITNLKDQDIHYLLLKNNKRIDVSSIKKSCQFGSEINVDVKKELKQKQQKLLGDDGATSKENQCGKSQDLNTLLKNLCQQNMDRHPENRIPALLHQPLSNSHCQTKGFPRRIPSFLLHQQSLLQVNKSKQYSDQSSPPPREFILSKPLKTNNFQQNYRLNQFESLPLAPSC